MKKSRVIKLVVLTFLIGGLVGNQATEWYKNKIFRQVFRLHYFMKVTEARGALCFLRSEQFEHLITLLETELESGLKGLQRFTDYSSEKQSRQLEEIEEEIQNEKFIRQTEAGRR